MNYYSLPHSSKSFVSEAASCSSECGDSPAALRGVPGQASAPSESHFHTSKHLKTSYSRLQDRASQPNEYQLQSSATPFIELSDRGVLFAAVPRALAFLSFLEAELLRSFKGLLVPLDREVPTN